MKKKPQIGYWPSWSPSTVWTQNNKPIEYEVARQFWDAPGSADWSRSAYQAMAAIVMQEGSNLVNKSLADRENGGL